MGSQKSRRRVGRCFVGFIRIVTVVGLMLLVQEAAAQGDWSLEGRFISYSSLCNMPRPALSPQIASGDASILLTICTTLEEELEDPLALVVKIRNSTHTSQMLRIPFPPDVIINYGDVSESAYVLYHFWEPSLPPGLSIFGTPWLKLGRGTLETRVAAFATIELMYLVPRFSGKAAIEFGDIGSFTVTSLIDTPGVNDPPVVSDIPDQTIDEGGTFTTISLDDYVSDPDNEDFEMVWTYSGNVELSIGIGDDRVATITIPEPEWSGSEIITFTATDPGGLSASDIATFTVIPVNDPPMVKDIPDQTVEEGNIFEVINLDDYVSDPDNSYDEITWTYSDNVNLGVSISINRVATINALDPEWNGNEIISFTATDPDGLSDGSSMTFTVNPVNDSPVVSDIPNQEINEGNTFASITLDEYVTDPDNVISEINWTYTGNTELVVGIDENRIATVTTPDPEWIGSETITFTATDPDGLSASDTAAFTVIPVNDPPVAVSDSYSVDEDNTLTISAPGVLDNDSDIDSDSLTAVKVSEPSHGMLTLNSDGFLIYNPDLDYNGNDSFTYKANDGSADSDVATVSITVNPVNDPPIVSDIPDQVIEEGGMFASINLGDYVSDMDNEDSEIIWTYSGNVKLAVSIGDDHITTITIPDPCWYGSETITFTATDPDGLNNSDSAVFAVNIGKPPVVSDIPDQVVEEGEIFADIILSDYVSDPDSENTEIAWAYSGNSELSISIVDNRIATVAIPDTEWSGSETIVFTASDQCGLSSSDSAAFTVGSVNDPPLVSDIPDQEIGEGDTFASVALDDYVSDPDNEYDELVWTSSGRAELSVSISDDRIATIATPDPEWSGSETITFTATDPDGLNNSDIVSFKVNPVNDPPVVSDIQHQSIEAADEFASIRLDDYVSDPDNEDSEMTWVSAGNTKLTINISKESIASVTLSDPAWGGTETVTFTATDPSGLSSSKSVTFTVTQPPTSVDPGGKARGTWGILRRTVLYQNYPNPFNPDTWIPYQLAGDVDVKIRIYDISGKLVRILDLGHKPAGFYTDKSRSAYWDGMNEAGEQASSGLYFYTIQAGDFTTTRKMTLAK